MHQWNDSYFVIYNEQELNNTFGPFTKGVSQEHPTLSFSQAPLNNSKIIITYGIRSQYILGYGFQKVDKSFSDSVRLMDTDNTSPKILDESNGELSALTFENSSLFISLDDSDEKTILKLFNVPLLYSPELNITFTFDHLILDLLDSFGNDFNNLAIEFKYITNDGYYEFYSDPLIIPLNYSEISSNIIDNTYAINYNKDLQAIYDMVGADSVDIEIIVHQSGKSSNYIPYIILNQYDYLSDTHLVETYDRMPINKYCNLDINSVITTPHYFQIFSRPFVDGAYGDSPFNLFDGSQVTIALTDLPNSTLVSLDSNGGENYNFNYWGTSKTLSVSEDNFYMIRNLGMFIDTYNIDETLYQDGYLDLYYGSGTEIDGEKQYINNIFMDYAGVSVEDYTSASSYNVPTSWNNTYDFTNKFLTTDAIKVEGQVFYHQIFDLETDLNSSSVINDIFPNYENDIYFGLQLTSNFDIDEIRAVSKPYFYSLSVQGFPTGKYKENYCSIQSTSSGDFDPTPKLIDEDYALDYDEDGTAYVLFFRPVGDLGSYTDSQNKIMIDYWVNHQFVNNYDYYIKENPEDPYTSQIEWDYSYTDCDTFHLHPDFTSETYFTVDYIALEWEIFDDEYIKDGDDSFDFQPKEFYNISVLYTGDTSTDEFSVQYIVPENQYLEDHLIFPAIYALAQ